MRKTTYHPLPPHKLSAGFHPSLLLVFDGSAQSRRTIKGYFITEEETMLLKIVFNAKFNLLNKYLFERG